MNARIAIIGLGATGLSLIRFFANKGYICEGFDERMANAPENISIPVHLGPLHGETLCQFDHIYLSPGIPWQHPALQAAKAAGIPVQGDLDVFLEHTRQSYVAITGTNGKTTTTHMINQLLATLPEGCISGGNIGTPMLELLASDTKRVALELSSFQLERCHAAIKPQWAVLLNIQEDHADMHTSPEDYAAAKLRLFAHQAAGDTAMLPDDAHWNHLADTLETRGVRMRRFGKTGHAIASTPLDCGVAQYGNSFHLFWSQGTEKASIDCNRLHIHGTHQYINLAIAAQAAADFGVGIETIAEQITSFAGLAHRLQYVGISKNHACYDDSKATNPEAAFAALQSFGKVHWICGGLLKDLSLASMHEVVRNHVEQLWIIGIDPAPFVELAQHTNTPYQVCADLTVAVDAALHMHDDLPLLLAPACASQDQFKNYAQRGDMFIAAVQAAKHA